MTLYSVPSGPQPYDSAPTERLRVISVLAPSLAECDMLQGHRVLVNLSRPLTWWEEQVVEGSSQVTAVSGLPEAHVQLDTRSADPARDFIQLFMGIETAGRDRRKAMEDRAALLADQAEKINKSIEQSRAWS